MEDFAREIETGSALFLLYGEEAVGKTRLLRELQANRLADARVHWIDMRVAENEDGDKADRSREIEEIFETAQSGDILIADHFESALKKTRHQLFLSWSTDGIDKKLNLIIASNIDGFDELRQLSQQYQARVQSFQQMPLTPDEVEAFIGFYLFPDHPVGKLTIPAPMRQQLDATGGIIGRVIEIADHDGSHIKVSALADSESIRSGSRIILSLLILFVLCAGAGWYWFSRPGELPQESLSTIEPTPAVQAESPAQQAESPAQQAESPAQQAESPAQQAESPAQQAESSAPQETGLAASTVEMPPAAPVQGMEDKNVASEGDADTSPEQARPVTQENEVDETPAAALEGEPGTALDSEAVLDGSDVMPPEEPVDVAAQPVAIEVESPVAASRPDDTAAAEDFNARFQREVKQSLDWIFNRDEKLGTVQILLLSYENFNIESYYEYVDGLAQQQVDTSELRIFKTLVGGSVVYSVVYGEYDSRQAAYQSIDSLPEVLRKTSPIPRSVGGLWQEIRRLESQN